MYPALTVAEQFAAEPDEVLFVGTPGGLESRLARSAGIEFRGLPAAGFDRARPWTLITSSALIAVSTVRAWSWLGAMRPDCVIGFGGYVSIPVGFAALMRRIPLVLHEQNSVPGLANRVLSRWATSVGVTYEDAAPLMRHPERVVVTGNPVRPRVLASSREDGRRALGIADRDILVLVFGGSRGARHLNSAFVGLRGAIAAIPEVQVIHIAGRDEADTVRKLLEAAGGDLGGRWRILDYVDDMGPLLAASDLVVARAGATSIAEITALGLPAVLVPYPYATDDHQTKNAAMMVEHGAAEIVADRDLDSERFGDVVSGLLGDGQRRANMAAASRDLGRPDAAARVAALVRDAVRDRAGKGRSEHDSTKESRG